LPMCSPNKRHYEDFFNKGSCDFCGTCLSECPVMKLPSEEAKSEIAGLVENREPQLSLTRCHSCMSCDLSCPNDSRPYSLILARWYQRYRKEGLPAIAKFLLPYQKDNFSRRVAARFPDDEKTAVEGWMQLRPKTEIFYPGCNFLLLPYLSFTKIFSGFTIMGSPDLCCGEQYYRTGLLDVFEDIGSYLQGKFKNLGVKKIVTPCIACSNQFSDIHPKFGAKFDFEVETVLDWLSRMIHDEKLKLKKVGNDRTVTLHDNCQAKPHGNHFFNSAREILEMLGYKVTEMKHNRGSALCCGMAAFAAKHSIDDIFAASSRRLKEAEETGSKTLVTYCTGCLWTLTMANTLNPRSKLSTCHLIELVQIALGEKPAHRHNERAKQIFDEAMKGASALATRKERIWLKRETS